MEKHAAEFEETLAKIYAISSEEQLQKISDNFIFTILYKLEKSESGSLSAQEIIHSLMVAWRIENQTDITASNE